MGMDRSFCPERKRLIYKEYAKTYDEDRRINVGEETLNERMRYVASHVQEGSKVLDLGCGTGDLLTILSQRVGHDGWCVGIDISPEMLGLGYAACPSGTTEAEKCYSDIAKECIWYFYSYRQMDEIFQGIFTNVETVFQPNPKASLSESEGKAKFKLLSHTQPALEEMRGER